MPASSAHGSFLAHRDFVWVRRALWLCALALIAYVAWDPIGDRNGGTAVGYGLGGLGAAMILWLAWLGVKKRRFASKRSPAARARRAPASAVATPPQLKGWTSAHVYLGLSLILIGTLHTGFEFGWNVHTLAYALMMGVILSGMWGVFAYLRYPNLMSENRAGVSVERLRREIADIDTRLARLTQRLPDAYVGPVRLSLEKTRIGGGAGALLSGSSRRCATHRALRQCRRVAAEEAAGDQADVAELIAALSRKAELCARLRRDLSYKAAMDVWLWAHVPLTIALIAALIAHVIVVFFYW